jgi:hypothetical protein
VFKRGLPLFLIFNPLSYQREGAGGEIDTKYLRIVYAPPLEIHAPFSLPPVELVR